jgi:hypothetical protein
MDAVRLQDRVRWGLNVAARSLGQSTDAYRPRGPLDPLDPVNRYLRLHAVFTPPDGSFTRANGYGAALWQGLFDAAYTRVGDYLVQAGGTWFVAAQQALLPVLCVRATRVVSLARPAAPSSSGVNTYGGTTAATNTPLLNNWPANIIGASGGGTPTADLPSDASVPYWTVLLPAIPGVTLQLADIMTDDLGRNAVVAAAELSDLGWRLSVKQATT